VRGKALSGSVGCGMARYGKVSPGFRSSNGLLSFGTQRLGRASLGMAGQGLGVSNIGSVRQGGAGREVVWHGMARQGK